MDQQPTALPPQTQTPLDRADPVTALVVQNRSTVAMFLAGLGILAVIGGLILLVSAWPKSSKADLKDKEKTVSKDKKADPLNPEEKPEEKKLETETVNMARLLGGLGAAIAGIVVVTCGVYLYIGIPKPTMTEQLQDARALILAAGGGFGLVLFFTGAGLLWQWFDILYEALTLDKSSSDAPLWKPLSALLLAILGLGTTFFAAQPARSEERNNATLRKLVYSVNLALGMLLLIVILVGVNIVASARIPNRLDTTTSGMFSLTEATRLYLGELKDDIQIFVVLPPNDIGTDISRLLSAFRDANPARIQVKSLSPSMDKSAIEDLASKYPAFNKSDLGVLIVVGKEEKKQSFVRAMELVNVRRERDGSSKEELVGEGRITREILFLTEKATAPVIYFTQSSGEISIEPPGEGEIRSRRQGQDLIAALSKDGATVKPLKFDPAATEVKIPDDCSILVVADPTSPLPKSLVVAIDRYMTPIDPKAPKGKLLLIAGGHNLPGDSEKLLVTGLEDVVKQFSIELHPKIFCAMPSQRNEPTTHFLVTYEGALEERNSIAMGLEQTTYQTSNVRRLTVAQNRQAPSPITANYLMHTAEARPNNWFEGSVPSDPRKAYASIVTAANAGRNEFLIEREFSGKPRLVAAAAYATEQVSTKSEETKQEDKKQTVSRLVVFSFADVFVDGQTRGREGVSPSGELISASINWLRDRPAVANITPKTYASYRPNPAMSMTASLWIPLFASLFAVGGLGLGVWAVRRK